LHGMQKVTVPMDIGIRYSPLHIKAPDLQGLFCFPPDRDRTFLTPPICIFTAS
jgi:hypothetical protein